MIQGRKRPQSRKQRRDSRSTRTLLRPSVTHFWNLSRASTSRTSPKKSLQTLENNQTLCRQVEMKQTPQSWI